MMFLLRSWTQPDSPLPYQSMCDNCKENVAFETEAERWRWSQNHTCPLTPTKIFYLPKRGNDASRKV
jgi:hypothetical protein